MSIYQGYFTATNIDLPRVISSIALPPEQDTSKCIAKPYKLGRAGCPQPAAMGLESPACSTRTAPIDDEQHASNNPIRSRPSSFQFFSAIPRSHPSGIKPSKKGNSEFDTYGSLLSGIVQLTATGKLSSKYAASYWNVNVP